MRILFTLLVLLLTSPAFSQTGSDCAKTQNDDQRLRCYDLLFKVTPESPPSEGTGNWTVDIDSSKIDDSRLVTIITSNNNDVTDRFGNRKVVSLLIGCKENKTSLIVHFSSFMSTNNGGGRVTYRVDKKAAEKISMGISNSKQALGLWGGVRSIPFIRKLFGGKTLLIRATPYSESSITATFNIAGIENAIKPLAEACNWKQ